MSAEQFTGNESQPLNNEVEIKQLAINEVRSNSKINELPNNLSSFFNSQLSQIERNLLSESNNSNDSLSNIKVTIEKLAVLKKSFSPNAGFNEFGVLLSNLKESSKWSAIKGIAEAKIDDLLDAFQSNGIPSTECVFLRTGTPNLMIVNTSQFRHWAKCIFTLSVHDQSSNRL